MSIETKILIRINELERDEGYCFYGAYPIVCAEFSDEFKANRKLAWRIHRLYFNVGNAFEMIEKARNNDPANMEQVTEFACQKWIENHGQRIILADLLEE